MPQWSELWCFNATRVSVLEDLVWRITADIHMLRKAFMSQQLKLKANKSILKPMIEKLWNLQMKADIRHLLPPWRKNNALQLKKTIWSIKAKKWNNKRQFVAFVSVCWVKTVFWINQYILIFSGLLLQAKGEEIKKILISISDRGIQQQLVNFRDKVQLTS